MAFGHHLLRPRDWLDAGYSAFVTALDAAVYERDTALLAGVLSTEPRLGLYNRVIEVAELVKEYLLRRLDGHRAAKIRFQFCLAPPCLHAIALTTFATMPTRWPQILARPVPMMMLWKICLVYCFSVQPMQSSKLPYLSL